MTTASTAPKGAKGRRRSAAPTGSADAQSITIDTLLHCSQRELDELFAAATPGPMPDGEGEGTVIIATGTPLTGLVAPALRLLWQGKILDRDGGTLKNRITPLGVPLIAARLDRGRSRLDGRPVTVLDYSKTSLVARSIRDEIRQVAPGLYLGVVYVYGRKTINFALQF